MKKGYIIIGKQSSGKNTKAKELIKKASPVNVIWLEGYDYEHSIHKYCKPDTEVIVIDEIESITKCVEFFGNLSQKLKVHPIGKESFEITPKLIFIKELSNPNKRAEAYYKSKFPLYEIINTSNL